MNKQSDKELLEKVKTGGEEGRQSLAVLYDRYNPYIHGQAQGFIPDLPSEIEDFCSEVWTRTIKAIPDFRGNSLKALLGRAYWGGTPEGIIGHYAVEFLRQKAHQPDSLDVPVGQEDDNKPIYRRDTITSLDRPVNILETASDIQQKAERRAIVRDEIMKLSKPDIYLIYLTYWQGRTARQVGEILGVSEKMVWKRLSRAREKLSGPLAERLNIRFKK